MNKALVLGGSYYIGLSITRCLGSKKVPVVVCDSNKSICIAAKSRYASEYLQIDNLYSFDSTVLAELINYAKKEELKPVLFPSNDKAVEFIDNNYEELNKYFLISQAANGLNSLLMNKKSLAALCLEHRVKIPYTIYTSEEGFEKHLPSLPYPCILKPEDTTAFWNAFMCKVFICENEADLLEKLKLCHENKLAMIIQEIVPGFDDHMLTYDFYVSKEGKTTHYMTAQKLRQWPINFGASVFTIHKYQQALVDIGRPFIEAIGYRGFGEIEFKKHAETGEIYLIEINTRTTNFNNLIYKLGINMPYNAYEELCSKLSSSKYIQHDSKRAFVYGLHDVKAMLAYHKSSQLSLFQSCKSYFKYRLAPAIFKLTDLRPWLVFNYTSIIRHFRGKRQRRQKCTK